MPIKASNDESDGTVQNTGSKVISIAMSNSCAKNREYCSLEKAQGRRVLWE